MAVAPGPWATLSVDGIAPPLDLLLEIFFTITRMYACVGVRERKQKTL
jgi:hypothetical protein